MESIEIGGIGTRWVNPCQPSFAFHIETSYLICIANQLTGFYMKRIAGLKLVNILNVFKVNNKHAKHVKCVQSQ